MGFAYEIILNTIEAACLLIVLCNVTYAYFQLGLQRTWSNWGTALAQTSALVWAILSWVVLDVKKFILSSEEVRVRILQSIGPFILLAFGLQLSIVLKWLPATQQCLHYNPHINTAILTVTSLIFLASTTCIILGITRMQAGMGIDPLAKFGQTIWGGYSMLLAMAIAGTVAATVLRIKKQVLETRTKFIEKGQYDKTVAWLTRISRVIVVGNVLVAAVVIAGCATFIRARAGERLPASLAKFA
ncbi:hypothetical protein HK104_003034 [Borealophlyctis nickersoniae]|nr:hypothetical protein HK104_003034 [Borealophlyctis nickersoniae]